MTMSVAEILRLANTNLDEPGPKREGVPRALNRHTGVCIEVELELSNIGKRTYLAEFEGSEAEGKGIREDDNSLLQTHALVLVAKFQRRDSWCSTGNLEPNKYDPNPGVRCQARGRSTTRQHRRTRPCRLPTLAQSPTRPALDTAPLSPLSRPKSRAPLTCGCSMIAGRVGGTIRTWR